MPWRRFKTIDEYFAKLPDGFVKELKTYQDYEEYPDRKIYIYVSGDGITDVKMIWVSAIIGY